jgi:hypothetical protein
MGLYSINRNNSSLRTRVSSLVAATVMTAGSLVAAAPLFLNQTAFAATSNNVVVTESDVTRQAENTPPTDNWVIYNRAAGGAAFREGPGAPPAVTGSLQLTTPTGTDKITAFNYDQVGTTLSAIDALGYSTYRTTGSADQVAAINIEVDVNGAAPGGFTTLVFEPTYNTGQQAVVSGVWQDWDAFNGGDAIWWSSNAIPSAPNRDTFVSWDTIVAANPAAVIVGGFGVNQGSGNPALITATDALSIGKNGNTTTYDFELFKVATDKDACKNDGYKNITDANGNGFKNQGQCVSYVNGRENHQNQNALTKVLSRFF